MAGSKVTTEIAARFEIIRDWLLLSRFEARMFLGSGEGQHLDGRGRAKLLLLLAASSVAGALLAALQFVGVSTLASVLLGVVGLFAGWFIGMRFYMSMLGVGWTYEWPVPILDTFQFLVHENYILRRSTGEDAKVVVATMDDRVLEASGTYSTPRWTARRPTGRQPPRPPHHRHRSTGHSCAMTMWRCPTNRRTRAASDRPFEGSDPSVVDMGDDQRVTCLQPLGGCLAGPLDQVGRLAEVHGGDADRARWGNEVHGNRVGAGGGFHDQTLLHQQRHRVHAHADNQVRRDSVFFQGLGHTADPTVPFEGSLVERCPVRGHDRAPEVHELTKGGAEPGSRPWHALLAWEAVTTNGDSPVLAAERAAVARIRAVHQSELERVRGIAAGLADEAAAQTDDQIRDLVDPDAEVDAAVEAAVVRQTSQRAIAAARRVSELEARGSALAFGHMTDKAGERLYIGRYSVIEGDEPLLVDWRARASTPFYRATPLEPLGVVHRRHLQPGDGISHPADEVIGYSDEVFDLEALAAAAAAEGTEAEVLAGLRGEAALLASVSAPTPEQMRSVVATIQAEQDAVVRAPANGPLLVEGGPGTGKTVVALHRAAYLLYDQRDELADTGVLIVGPSPAFLRYIAEVLPSLGESGVVSLTPPELYVGIRIGGAESPATAQLKGRAEMVSVLRNGLADRRRTPTGPLRLYYGSQRVTLSVEHLRGLFDRARRHIVHNDGADEFHRLVLESLLAEVHDPSFVGSDRVVDNASATFRRSGVVQRLLLRHFPPLSPEQALNDLFGSHALLQSAGRGTGLSAEDLSSLHRPRNLEVELDARRWTDADVPLLDELLHLVGGAMGQSEEDRLAERDVADEFELAASLDEPPEISIDPIERPDDPEDIPLPAAKGSSRAAGPFSGAKRANRARLAREARPSAASGPAVDSPITVDPITVDPITVDGAIADGSIADKLILDEAADDDPWFDPDMLLDLSGGASKGQAESGGGPAEPDLELATAGRPATVAEFDDRRVGVPTEDDLDEDDVREDELWVDDPDSVLRDEPTVVELAFGQRSWRFGHVIVDEAQDLTPMQWRMVMRRARGRSMTIVGDLAQRTTGPVSDWADHLPPELAAIDRRPLTVNYRSPSAINELASAVLAELAPDVTPSRAIRHQPDAVRVVPLAHRPPVALDALVVEEREALVGGRLAVIGVDLDRDRWEDVVVVDPAEAKGLEFDVVIVAEPAAIVRLPRGLALLYVALTRATQRLVLAHDEPLPPVLANAALPPE